MKLLPILLISLLMASCSQSSLEEYTFRKTLELNLIDMCGDDNKGCIAAVKSMTGRCMEKSGWRKYLNNEENDVIKNRFLNDFYSCITDQDGKPYFVTNAQSQ